jgi:hypothetical protein
MLFRVKTFIYTENNPNPINTPIGQNAEFFDVETGSIYSMRFALRD